MGGSRLPVLRVAVGVVALAAMAACSTAGSSAGGEDDRGAGGGAARSSSAGPTTDVTAHPISDHGSRIDEDGRVVVGWSDPEVDVGFFLWGGPGPAVLQFAPITTPVDCIVLATLEVTVTDHDSFRLGPRQFSVAVYPGDPAVVATADDDVLPDWGMLLDNRPRGVLGESGATTARADITLLVRTWAAGGPFPSRGKVVDPAGPLVLVVQPESAESPQTFRLSTTESGPETAPALTITTDC